MSKIKLTGHASGSGVLTIAAPNTDSDRTITLPDVTGTLLDSGSDLPAANLTGSIAIARITDGTITAAKVAADVATQAELDTVSTVASAALPKAGGTMTGNIALNDNVQARFGSDNDLKIYHDGSNSYIDDTGTGNLYIKSNADNYINLISAAADANLGFIYKDSGGTQRGFLLFDSDDYVMKFGTDSEKMLIDSAGRVTMPSQPFFWGRLPNNATKTAGWNTSFGHYTQVVVNRGSHYNTSTGNFTCPVAGDYEIAVGGFFSTASDGTRVGIEVKRNGTSVQMFGGQLSDGDTPFPFLRCIINCSANDTLNAETMYTPIAVATASGIYALTCQVRLLG